MRQADREQTIGRNLHYAFPGGLGIRRLIDKLTCIVNRSLVFAAFFGFAVFSFLDSVAAASYEMPGSEDDFTTTQIRQLDKSRLAAHRAAEIDFAHEGGETYILTVLPSSSSREDTQATSDAISYHEVRDWLDNILFIRSGWPPDKTGAIPLSSTFRNPKMYAIASAIRSLLEPGARIDEDLKCLGTLWYHLDRSRGAPRQSKLEVFVEFLYKIGYQSQEAEPSRSIEIGLTVWLQNECYPKRDAIVYLLTACQWGSYYAGLCAAVHLASTGPENKILARELYDYLLECGYTPPKKKNEEFFDAMREF